MKTNTGAVRVVALAALAALLAALLALLSGACAGACGPYTTAPKIAINAHAPPTFDGIYTASYGEEINLHCSAKNADNLKIHRNGKLIHTDNTNTTTVQLSIKQPQLGVYTYSCAGSNGCEDSLTVAVVPAMSVQSSRAYYKLDEGFIYVFVPLGEHYEIFCSGNDAAFLLFRQYRKELQAEIVNKTTIKHITQADRVDDEDYWCAGKGILVNGEEKYVQQMMTVTVDYYPEGKQFWCFIGSWTTLECSWNYTSDIKTFRLFYKERNDEAILLCAGASDETDDKCEWDISSKSFFNNENVSFILIACNEYVCNNQTFTLNTRSIIKLDTVSELRVLETNSQDALLEWNSRFWRRSAQNLDYWGRFVCENCVYKVEYQMLTFGDEWRQTMLWSMRCDDRFCRFRLSLPYPDLEYNVKVCVRFSEATDDRLWSQPKSMRDIARVSTAVREKCACSAASAQQIPEAPTFSSETASCKACSLTDDVIKGSLALKNQIITLKKKLAKINKISKLLSNSRNSQ